MAQRTDSKSKTASDRSKSVRTQPIPDSISKVRGYGTLTIYRMPASPFWYVRYYEDKKIYRRSLKTDDKRTALKAAQEFFAEFKLRKMNKLPLTNKSGFEAVARGLQKENEARFRRGELSATKLEYDRARLEKDLLSHFKDYQIADINYSAIVSYVEKLSAADRNLSTNSIKIHLSHLKTIFKHAQRMDVITSLPAFPTMRVMDKPRPWFSFSEYQRLLNMCRARIGEKYEKVGSQGEQLRTIEITQELYELINFMKSTFIRPTDIKVLKHKHITIVRRDEHYLRLEHPPTKGHSSPVVSMPFAVEVYERIVARQKKEGFGKPDDYVFQPQHKDNRDYAMRTLQRQFDQLLRVAGLKTNSKGESRSLYSLRHSAIMMRLVGAEGLDLLTLARNARTSVEILDRFYAKHLTAEMNVAAIQSKRKRNKKPAEAGEGDEGQVGALSPL